MRAQYDSCRTRLGRLRCLRQCIAAYKSCETFPEPLGYVCQDIPFKCTASFLDTHTAIKTFNAPTSSPNHSESNQDLTSTLKDVLPVGSIQCDSDTEFFTNGQPMVTHYGMWLKVFAVSYWLVLGLGTECNLLMCFSKSSSCNYSILIIRESKTVYIQCLSRLMSIYCDKREIYRLRVHSIISQRYIAD